MCGVKETAAPQSALQVAKTVTILLVEILSKLIHMCTPFCYRLSTSPLPACVLSHFLHVCPILPHYLRSTSSFFLVFFTRDGYRISIQTFIFVHTPLRQDLLAGRPFFPTPHLVCLASEHEIVLDLVAFSHILCCNICVSIPLHGVHLFLSHHTPKLYHLHPLERI